MKWFLILWAGPILLLAGWYGLSYYDLSFGFFLLTRSAHDLVFQIYGQILGVAPEILPPLVARAIAVDSLIVLAILAYRKRRQIRTWWRGGQEPSSVLAIRPSDDNLSNAP